MKTAGDSRLRIAVLIRHFVSTGGAEKYCVELTRRLAQRHEVHVFAQTFGEEKIPGIVIHRLRHRLEKPRFLNQWLFSRQTRVAVGGDFDIVHSHDMLGHADVYTLHVPCFRSRYTDAAGVDRLKLRVGTLLSPRLLSYYLMESLQFSDKRRRKSFIAVSDYLRRNILSNYPAARGRLFIAYPGLDAGAIAPLSKERRLRVRRELGLAAGGFVCLFVANDFEKKGLAPLLEALSRIEGDCSLVIAGGGRQRAYRTCIEELGLEHRVLFVGVQRDLSRLFASADVLVHPTRVDSFGMAVLEAMGHGLPVIVSNREYCGIAEQLTDDETALLLADPGDADEIGRRIAMLMGDGRLRSRLGENARIFASGASWERTADATLDAYRALASDPARVGGMGRAGPPLR